MQRSLRFRRCGPAWIGGSCICCWVAVAWLLAFGGGVAAQNASRLDLQGDPLPKGTELRLGTVRLRQRQSVMGVAFSPDSRQLVSTGWGDSIRFWDVKTGRQIRRLKVDDATFGVAFSPDGSKLASVGDSGFVRLWELSTGKVLFKTLGHQEHGHGTRTYGVAFAPDGNSFATAGGDLSVRLWDVATGQESIELKTDAKGIDARPVVFSADGKLLASGAESGTLHVWDLSQGGRPMVIPRAHGEGVVSVAFPPDGTTLVSSGSRIEERLADDGKQQRMLVSEIRVWDVATGDQIQELSADEELLGECSIALSADGTILASSHNDKIVVWELPLGEATLVIQTERKYYGGRSHGLAISPDGTMVATRSSDHTVRLFDTATGERIFLQRHTHTEAVISVDYSPDGSRIATGSQDGTVRLWDSSTAKHIRVLSEGTSWVRYVEFLPDREYVAIGAAKYLRDENKDVGEIKICRVSDGEVRHQFQTSDSMMCGALSPDGRLIAAGTGSESFYLDEKKESKVFVWDVGSGRQLAALSGHRGPIRDLAFDRDSLWSVSQDRTVRKWNWTAGLEVDRIALKIENIESLWPIQARFSPDAAGIFVGGANLPDAQTLHGWLTWHRFEEREPQFDKTFIGSWPSVLAVSPDGRVLATSFRANGRAQLTSKIVLWSTDQSQELFSFEIEDGSVRSLAFSRDGSKLVSGMDRGDALVWNISDALAQHPVTSD